MLQSQFTALLLKYTPNITLIQSFWTEIEDAYGNSERYFHNLFHLEQLYAALSPLQERIEDWDALLFSIFYHDIAYDVVQYVLENDNEERSAAIAETSLTTIGFPEPRMQRCKQHILATKTHQATGDADTNFFIDADLSILCQPWKDYHEYMKNIRKEYMIYPDTIYHAGRLKVLKQFLKMERVFKTNHFHNLYEAAARENMSREIEILSLL
jgi:predicted metal-dependent HD superfamily phosphohydrolase